MARPAAPPIDLFDFWHDNYLTGPGAGLQAYFDAWFAHVQPSFDSFPFSPGAARPVVVQQQYALGDRLVEYHFRNLDDKSSGVKMSYLVTADDDGIEQTWAMLTGMIDLDQAWRFDLIESFDGEPSYEDVKDIVIRYWRGEYAPRLLMQIDAKSMEFFFVPRESAGDS